MKSVLINKLSGVLAYITLIVVVISMCTLTASAEESTPNSSLPNLNTEALVVDEKVVVDLSTLGWDNPLICDGNYAIHIYDGNALTVTPIIPDAIQAVIDAGLLTVTPINYTGSEVGKYVAEYVIEYDPNAVTVIGTAPTSKWGIYPYELDVTDFVLNQNSFVYNGSSFNGAISLEIEIPGEIAHLLSTEEIIVNVLNHSGAGVNVGTYTTTFAFASDNKNFGFNYETYTLEWAITPKNVKGLYTISDFTLDPNGYTGIYNDAMQHVQIDFSKLPEGLELVECSGVTSAIDAGTYTFTATFRGVGNYTDTIEITFTWSIAKAKLDLSLITLTGKEVTYDGKAHNITVNAPLDILEKLTVNYSYDGIFDADNKGETLVGTYRVTAIVTLSGHKNYEDVNVQLGPANLVIKGDKKTNYQLPDGSVIVEAVGGLTPDYVLAGGTTNDVKCEYEIDGRDAEMVVAYDVYFTRGSNIANVDGKEFIVKILIPENSRNLNNNLLVIYIAEDGTYEVMNATRDGDYMCFTTNHLSVYSIVNAENNLNNATTSWFMRIILAIINFFKSLFS